MNCKKIFGGILALTAVLFFSCASTGKKKLAYCDVSLSIMVDEDPYTDGERFFSLRDSSYYDSLEKPDNEKKDNENQEGVYPFVLAGEEDTDKYIVNVLEGEYKLFEGEKDLNVFVTVAPDRNSVVYVECSSIDMAAKALRTVSAPSGLVLMVKERTYQTLGYDNLLQRSLAACASPVNMNISGCTNLTVGYRAFYGCSNLRSVILPESVSSLGKDSFSFCSSLRHINIPARVSSIEGGAFISCSSLDEIDIAPRNSSYIEKDGAILSSDGKTLVSWPSASGNVELPSGVETLLSYCFAGCKNLLSVDLCDAIEIQQYAFQNCVGMKGIDLPMTLMFIEAGALDGCTSLEKIQVAEGNVSFKSKGGILLAYDNRRLLAWPSAQGSVKVPDGITRIEDNAFQNQRGLNSIDLSSSVKEIGSQAFTSCIDLTSVAMPAVVNIEAYAFSKCQNLTSVTIPETTRRCDGSAFSECNSLKNISVSPNNVQYKSADGAIYSHDGKVLIEWPAASDSITIADSVETIGTYAFNGCVNLKSVSMSSVVTVGHHAFDSCKALEKVDFGEKVVTIGSHAFSNCLSIENLFVPSSVTTIKNYAFWFWGSNQKISCQTRTKPSGWDFAWNADCEAALVWGAEKVVEQ